MSKSRRVKHKAKRRQQKAIALLGQLAGDLNALERAGVRIRHPKEYALTSHGAVIRFREGWVPRPFKGGTPVKAHWDDD